MYWKAAAPTAAGLSLLTTQVLRAARRSDIPSLTNQDPSGSFGDPSLPTLHIVLLGDSSITAPGVEPLDDSWPRRAGRRLADRYHVVMDSVAVGGSKARDVLDGQIERALALEPDIAVVSVGANDALRATPITRYEQEMTEILGRLAGGIAGVGVSGIGDLGTLPRLPSLARGVARVRSRAFDRAVARAAANYPGVVKSAAWGDAWRLFAEGDPAEVFAGDLFHASGVGHAVFAQAFEPVIDELIRRHEDLRHDAHAVESSGTDT
jgi:lysophospholipase L1-like esterase